jgi:hypothetical protein
MLRSESLKLTYVHVSLCCAASGPFPGSETFCSNKILFYWLGWCSWHKTKCKIWPPRVLFLWGRWVGKMKNKCSNTRSKSNTYVQQNTYMYVLIKSKVYGWDLSRWLRSIGTPNLFAVFKIWLAHTWPRRPKKLMFQQFLFITSPACPDLKNNNKNVSSCKVIF